MENGLQKRRFADFGDFLRKTRTKRFCKYEKIYTAETLLCITLKIILQFENEMCAIKPTFLERVFHDPNVHLANSIFIGNRVKWTFNFVSILYVQKHKYLSILDTYMYKHLFFIVNTKSW